MAAVKFLVGEASRREILKVRLTAAFLQVKLDQADPKVDAKNFILPPPAITHNGCEVSSASAICKYLARTFESDVKLMPSALSQYIEMDQWLEWVASTLEPSIERNPSTAIIHLAKALSNADFLVGSEISLADIFVFSALHGAEVSELENHAGINSWMERVSNNIVISEVLKAIAKKEAKDKKKKATGIDLNPPSGTRDFFPDQMRFRSWLFGHFRGTARSFGFQEYDAPVLESEELYKRKAGEEITQQMYNFVDKEGNRVTLRPEMTPTLARMVLSLCREATGDVAAILPLKWFSLPQCWRFETTQRGRKREHYQWNMDIVGIPGITAELEVLAAAVEFFRRVGLTHNDVGLKVNSRKVLGALVEKAGVPKEQFAPVCIIIDKLDKIGGDAVAEELGKIGVSDEIARQLIGATEAKSLEEFAAISGTTDSPEVAELTRLFTLAKDYGIHEWLQFDASVVRGLAYYTGVVFEGFDRSGEMRAICGGGRYDRLLTLYGAKKEMPCVGFGFGDCVIEELLKVKGLMPNMNHQVDYIVAAYNNDMQGPAMTVAKKMRDAGLVVDLMQEVAKKVGKAFSYADRMGARRIVFVGPSEWENNMVRVKDLREQDENEKQKDIPLDDLDKIDSYFTKTA